MKKPNRHASMLGSKEPVNLHRQQSIVISDQSLLMSDIQSSLLYAGAVSNNADHLNRRILNRICSSIEASAAFLAQNQIYASILADWPPLWQHG